jgi:hypothetical protein
LLHESALEFVVKLLKETVYLEFLSGQGKGQDRTYMLVDFRIKEFNSRVF